MDRQKIQAAAARILTSYLASHKVEPGQISSLIARVGQALMPTTPPVEAEVVISVGRRQRRQFRRPDDGDAQRIEHPDQPDMFNETEAVLAEALIGETAGEAYGEADSDRLQEDDLELDDAAQSKRGPRSGRDIAEADAQTTVEDGVAITRIPEVRRRRLT